ncbi:BTAD domain-containing putative transcriptional regulator [Glycomyces luteolus]|uniref:BTAD domain-containing putative transcriptional regulator n=1 Tax=Glycomyces luteolus TaxID=2670330 RepID=A0A9X3SUI2_9ACTN|nr:BTAD domain-containing putative transcriptional regulator [Glycomyces luteolus]MDA1361393.1 BTAD domain-containing putative transcriptional regulator [Glycomyces luteolus]
MSANAQEFRVLGSLQLAVNGRAAALDAAKPRTLLALFLLNLNRPVGQDWLIDQLWGEHPPKTADATLRSYVYQLRKRLRGDEGGPVLRGRNKGYVLEAADEAVDAHRFEVIAAKGRQALQGNRPGEGGAMLREGLGLWRGAASFADIDAPAVRDKARLLDELRLEVLERCLAAELESGMPTTTIAELEALTVAHPLREGLWRLLMLGLYRAGRQAEALSAHQRLYRLLDAELGIKPSPPLEELHQQILRYDPRLRLAVPDRDPAGGGVVSRPTVPRQLPSSAAHFTGRVAQLSALDRLLAAPAESTGAATAAVITGAAGIGKTALAVHWAHRVADRFPDGQLYVNLRGFDPVGQPVTPGEAVRGFLEALHTPPNQISSDLDAQAALYRSLLADKRVLVVLDNARDFDQVRPLLPGTASDLVLVTSRNSISGLIAHGARPIALVGLDPEEAARFLERRIQDGRTAAEPEAAERIAEACEGLPLALAIVAARAATRPDFSLTSLAAALHDARDRLDVLADPDPAIDLRTVFSWSYQALTADAARLFRLLSTHPGPDITQAAAAAVAGTTASAGSRLLVELTRGNLLTEPTPGRFAFHDLLRAYSAELADAVDTCSDRKEATRRLLDFYLHTAHAASRLVDPNRDPIRLSTAPSGVPPVRLADGRAAMVWFASEGAALTAAVHHAAEHGFDTHCWQLAYTLRDHLDRGPWEDQTAVWQTAMKAARTLGDSDAEARLSRLLAEAYSQLGRTEDARALLDRSLALCRHSNDRVSEAHAHLMHGRLWTRQGRNAEALESAQRALDLYRATGHRVGQANALNGIGWAHSQSGDHRKALAYCEEAVALLEAIGDRHGQAAALDSLGYTHHCLGRQSEAIAFYQRALALYRDLGHSQGEATTFVNLADAQHANGDSAAARRTWRRALAILEHVGHADAEKVRAKLGALHPPGSSGTDEDSQPVKA